MGQGGVDLVLNLKTLILSLVLDEVVALIKVLVWSVLVMSLGGGLVLVHGLLLTVVGVHLIRIWLEGGGVSVVGDESTMALGHEVL